MSSRIATYETLSVSCDDTAKFESRLDDGAATEPTCTCATAKRRGVPTLERISLGTAGMQKTTKARLMIQLLFECESSPWLQNRGRSDRCVLANKQRLDCKRVRGIPGRYAQRRKRPQVVPADDFRMRGGRLGDYAASDQGLEMWNAPSDASLTFASFDQCTRTLAAAAAHVGETTTACWPSDRVAPLITVA